MAELKPCPFCGRKQLADIEKGSDDTETTTETTK